MELVLYLYFAANGLLAGLILFTRHCLFYKLGAAWMLIISIIELTVNLPIVSLLLMYKLGVFLFMFGAAKDYRNEPRLKRNKNANK